MRGNGGGLDDGVGGARVAGSEVANLFFYDAFEIVGQLGVEGAVVAAVEEASVAVLVYVRNFSTQSWPLLPTH